MSRVQITVAVCFGLVVTYFQMRPIFSFYHSWPVQLFPVILFFLSSAVDNHIKCSDTWNLKICCLRDFYSPVFIFVFVVVWNSYKPIFGLHSHAMCVVACIHYYIIRGALSLSHNLRFFFISFVLRRTNIVSCWMNFELNVICICIV